MYEFIFLGLIPGTHIQLTFSAWLCAAAVLGGGMYARRALRSRAWHFPNVHGKFSAPIRRQAVRS